MRYQIQESKLAWIVIYLPFEILTLAQHCRSVSCENNSVLEMIIAWHAYLIDDRVFATVGACYFCSFNRKYQHFTAAAKFKNRIKWMKLVIRHGLTIWNTLWWLQRVQPLKCNWDVTGRASAGTSTLLTIGFVLFVSCPGKLRDNSFKKTTILGFRFLSLHISRASYATQSEVLKVSRWFISHVALLELLNKFYRDIGSTAV